MARRVLARHWRAPNHFPSHVAIDAPQTPGQFGSVVQPGRAAGPRLLHLLNATSALRLSETNWPPNSKLLYPEENQTPTKL